MIRDDIKAATIAAMKGGDKETTATLRLVSAAIKNRDIEARTGGAPADDDALVTEVLQKMIKQRRESAELYRKGGREDRAAAEEGEIAVIERFLPKQLSDDEAAAPIRAILRKRPRRATRRSLNSTDRRTILLERLLSRWFRRPSPSRLPSRVRTAGSRWRWRMRRPRQLADWRPPRRVACRLPEYAPKPRRLMATLSRSPLPGAFCPW